MPRLGIWKLSSGSPESRTPFISPVAITRARDLLFGRLLDQFRAFFGVDARQIIGHAERGVPVLASRFIVEQPARQLVFVFTLGLAIEIADLGSQTRDRAISMTSSPTDSPRANALSTPPAVDMCDPIRNVASFMKIAPGAPFGLRRFVLSWDSYYLWNPRNLRVSHHP